MKEEKLMWHWLVIAWLWHRAEFDISDEQAWVALTRLKSWVDEALGVLEGDPPAK